MAATELAHTEDRVLLQLTSLAESEFCGEIAPKTLVSLDPSMFSCKIQIVHLTVKTSFMDVTVDQLELFRLSAIRTNC